MDRSLRFRVYPCELDARFRLAFAPAPVLNTLASLARSNSPDHNAKGTQSPHRQPKPPVRLPPLVGTRFQVLFHSPPGVLFTFPSRYSCTIGRGRVFSLGGWSPRIQPGLLGAPGLLRYPCHTPSDSYAYRALTCCGGPFQAASAPFGSDAGQCPAGALQPRSPVRERFGLFRVRSPLLAESRLISLPAGTEMFQFPALAPLSR
jgi:hypothetical protein